MNTEAAGGPVPEPLRFENPHGGFSADGREYVIRLPWRGAEGHLLPPRPWINVIANEDFGCLVSERGAGCTWSGNSREHRLTPWSNDAVTDPFGELLLIEDEETGKVWSPLPGPDPLPVDYTVRHGFGHSGFGLVGAELDQDVEVFVPRHDPVKIVRLRIRNRTDRERRLRVWGAWRLVLGGRPEETAASVRIEPDPARGAVYAGNPEQPGFEAATAFVTGFSVCRDAGGRTASNPRDPAEIFGAPPERASSAGSSGERIAQLESILAPGLPGVALRIGVTLPPGGEAGVWLVLGEGADRAAAESLIGRYSAAAAVDAALAEIRAFWADALSRVQVETPDPAFDVMMNGWLAYQTLACRLWARSALYQSGGAFGFRDQLQDAASWIYLDPRRTRAQVLLHAAHQFVEGDVLHWWHPPLSSGIRTRFADDLLWLPYVTAFYLQTTGDRSILAERVRFLQARELAVGEDEAYVCPEEGGLSADLYEHCCRAIDRSLAVGAHGLPLFGTGDWNDGMNRVGREGRGESVWMAFFLMAVLEDFLPVCRERGDAAREDRYREHRAGLQTAANEAGWDGEWFRRGFYDDGTPLGSASGDECRIDALVQAWSVISGGASAERMRRVMEAADRLLVDDSGRIVKLLAPPLENTTHDPGYIKGYAPGVRENGGQYTHAALWVVRAFAELGQRDRAGELLAWINPICRTRSAEEIAVYQLEPYVVAADVYGVPPHLGRGGWSWYTGSAGWMYRVGLETLLGFQVREGTTLHLRPRIPDSWPQFTVRYGLPERGTHLTIVVRNPSGNAARVREGRLDGQAVRVDGAGALVPIPRDGAEHVLEVTLGA